MTTNAQIEANRRNSALSTGPRSAAGKDVSRRNALRHGLAARTLVVAPGEDAAEFRSFAADLRRDLAPGGAFEEALTQRIVILAWRLERTARIEAELLTAEPGLIAHAAGMDEPAPGVFPPEMAALARYEAAIDRSFERAMKLLKERQMMRLAGALPECAPEIAERTQFADADSAERSQLPEDESADRSQFADADSAERSQSADADSAERSQLPADESAERSQLPEDEATERSQLPEDESAERSQFAAGEGDEDEELPSPLDLIMRREAERLERARRIQEACRPKSAPAPV